MERTEHVPVIQVQKKLDFYVEESVADYLALMDGLAEAMQNNIRRVYAFTDSELLYGQVSLSNDKICVSYFYNADTTHYDYVI
jgi:ribonuclease HI